MSTLPSSRLAALVAAAACLVPRLRAQEDFQPSGLRLTPGGAVAWTWDTLHVGRDPGRLVPVARQTWRGILDVHATAEWIAVRHQDGVALLAWSDPARVVARIEVPVAALAGDGVRVLALDGLGTAWTLDTTGGWAAHAVDLAPGAVSQVHRLGARWVLALDEDEDPHASAAPAGDAAQDPATDDDTGGDGEAAETGGGADSRDGAESGEGAELDDLDDLGYSGFGGEFERRRYGALWHSLDGVDWERAATPARAGREPVAALAAGPRGALALFPEGEALASEDGVTWRAVTAPPLRSQWALGDVFVEAGGFHVFDHESPAPTLVHSSADLAAWTSAPLPPARLVLRCVAIGARAVWVGRAAHGRPLEVHPFGSLTTPWRPDLGPYPLPPGSTLDLLSIAQPLARLRAFGEAAYVLTREGYVHELAPDGTLGFGRGSAVPGGAADDFLVLPDMTVVLGGGRVSVQEPSRAYFYEVPPGVPQAKALFHVAGRFTALDHGDGFSFNGLPWLASGIRPTYPTRAVWRDTAPTPERWVLVGSGPDGGAVVASGNVTIDAARLPAVRGVPRAVASTWRDPLPAGPASAAAFALVTVGSEGLVLVSRDGVTWRGGNLEGEPDLVAVAYGAGQWGALSADGRLLVSSDGLGWRVGFASPDLALTHLTGTSRALIALSGRSARLTWSAAPEVLRDRAIARVVEVERPDRTQRVERLTLEAPPEALRGLVHDGARYVAAGAAGLLESDDGATFARAPVADQMTQGYDGVAQVGGRAWLWWGSAGGEIRLHSRLPGAPLHMAPPLGVARLDAIAGDEACVALAGVRERFVSSQLALITATRDGGRSWAASTPPVVTQERATLAFGAGVFVTTGRPAGEPGGPLVAARSRDLTSWEVTPLPPGVDAPVELRHAGGTFVALAPGRAQRGARLAVSRDGVAWRGVVFQSFRAPRLFASADRFWMHDGRALITSQDGVVWQHVADVAGSPAEWLFERAGVVFLGWSRDADGRIEPRLARLPRPSEAALAEAEYEPCWFVPTFGEALAELDRGMRRVPYPLARARAVDDFLAEYQGLTAEATGALADTILAVDRSTALAYVLAIATNDALAGALRARATPAERAALVEFARARVAEALVPTKSIERAPAVVVPGDGARAAGDFHVPSVLARYEATRDPAFAYDLAIAFDQGHGVARDEARAQRYADVVRQARLLDEGRARAAATGSVYASLDMLVEARERGDSQRERAWFRHAATQGSYAAREGASQQILFDGDLRLGTPAEAYEWLLDLARRGHGEAMNLLAIAIRHGLGVAPDEALAREWFAAGARFGSESAQKNLAAIEEHERELRAMMDFFLEQSAQEAEIWEGVDATFAQYAADMERALRELPDKAPK